MMEHQTLTPAADLDAMVATARRLCRKAAEDDDLPQRAALQTLVRFAQSTDSVEETVLFIEYQASRDTLKKYRRFLHEVAATIQQNYAADIGTVRRFLGLLARAGAVELEHARRTKDGRDGGDRGSRRR